MVNLASDSLNDLSCLSRDISLIGCCESTDMMTIVVVQVLNYRYKSDIYSPDQCGRFILDLYTPHITG